MASLTQNKDNRFAYVVDEKAHPFLLLKMVDAPKEVLQFQTCLRSWFVAYAVWFDDASETCEALSHDAIVYQVLDDLLESILEASLDNDLDKKDYHNLFLEPLGLFSSRLTRERKVVRDWFANFVSSFDDRADDLPMKTHGYAFATIDEYLQTYIAHRQQQIRLQQTPA